jgi:hypothetical protein
MSLIWAQVGLGGLRPCSVNCIEVHLGVVLVFVL